MKNFTCCILSFLVLLLVAATPALPQPPPTPTQCQQIITIRPMSLCQNNAVPGTNYCTTHTSQPPKPGKGLHGDHEHDYEAVFATCVVVQAGIPCNRQAIPGKTYCSVHEALIPPPVGCSCWYVVGTRGDGSYILCGKACANITLRCAQHYAPAPPVPPLQEDNKLMVCIGTLSNGQMCGQTTIPGTSYCYVHTMSQPVPPKPCAGNGNVGCTWPAVPGSIYCTFHKPPSISAPPIAVELK